MDNRPGQFNFLLEWLATAVCVGAASVVGLASAGAAVGKAKGDAKGGAAAGAACAVVLCCCGCPLYNERNSWRRTKKAR